MEEFDLAWDLRSSYPVPECPSLWDEGLIESWMLMLSPMLSSNFCPELDSLLDRSSLLLLGLRNLLCSDYANCTFFLLMLSDGAPL